MLNTRMSVKDMSVFLDVPTSTLYKWIKGEHIDMHLKYLKFLKLERIDLDKLV